MIDDGGRVVEFNPAAECTFGYPRDAALGRQLADPTVPPSLRDAHRAGLARYLDTRVPRSSTRCSADRDAQRRARVPGGADGDQVPAPSRRSSPAASARPHWPPPDRARDRRPARGRARARGVDHGRRGHPRAAASARRGDGLGPRRGMAPRRGLRESSAGRRSGGARTSPWRSSARSPRGCGWSGASDGGARVGVRRAVSTPSVRAEPGYRCAEAAARAGLRGGTPIPVRDGREVLGVPGVLRRRAARARRLAAGDAVDGRHAHREVLRAAAPRSGSPTRLSTTSSTGPPNRGLPLDRLANALVTARVATTRWSPSCSRTSTSSSSSTTRSATTSATSSCARWPCASTASCGTATRSSAGATRSARFGGDEFVVLLEDIPHEEAAIVVAERITAALAEPLTIEEYDLTMQRDVAWPSAPARPRRRTAWCATPTPPGTAPSALAWPLRAATTRRCARGCGSRLAARVGAAARLWSTTSCVSTTSRRRDRGRRRARGRGAAALGARGARAPAARGLHPAGRGERADRADRALGDRRGVPAVSAGGARSAALPRCGCRSTCRPVSSAIPSSWSMARPQSPGRRGDVRLTKVRPCSMTRGADRPP